MKNSIDKLKSAIEKINLTLARRGPSAPPPTMTMVTQPYDIGGVCCYTDGRGVKKCEPTTKEVCDNYNGFFNKGMKCEDLDPQRCGPAGGGTTAVNKTRKPPALIALPDPIDYFEPTINVGNDACNPTLTGCFGPYPNGDVRGNALKELLYHYLIDEIFDKGIEESTLPMVTLSDQPSPLFQEAHPEFDWNNPATWNTWLMPWLDRMIRYYQCFADVPNNPQNCEGCTNTDILNFANQIRAMLLNRCRFQSFVAGACCIPGGGFGTNTCIETAGVGPCNDQGGFFYPNKSCAEIGGQNCASGPGVPVMMNPGDQKQMVDEQKKAAGELIKQLKLFTRR